MNFILTFYCMLNAGNFYFSDKLFPIVLLDLKIIRHLSKSLVFWNWNCVSNKPLRTATFSVSWAFQTAWKHTPVSSLWVTHNSALYPFWTFISVRIVFLYPYFLNESYLLYLINVRVYFLPTTVRCIMTVKVFVWTFVLEQIISRWKKLLHSKGVIFMTINYFCTKNNFFLA